MLYTGTTLTSWRCGAWVSCCTTWCAATCPFSPSHRYSPNSSPGEVVTSHPSSRSVTSHTQLKFSDLSSPLKVSDLSPQLKVNDLSPQLKEIFVLNFLFTKHINVPRIDTFFSDYPLKASREHATVKKCPDSAKLFAHAIISTISKPYMLMKYRGPDGLLS